MNKRNYMALLALAATASMPLACNKPAEETTTPPTTTTTGGTTTSTNPRGGPPGAAMRQAPGMPGMPGMPGGGPGGMPATAGGPGATTSGAGGQGKTPVIKAPAIRVAQDPFKPGWHREPLPPYVFNELVPVRLASAGVVAPPPAGTTIKEFPTRRVSGIMSGDGIYAILEGGFGGEPEIVKPGSQTRDGYRVVAITSNSVRLQRKFGNLILEQTVPLTDVPAGAVPAGFRGGMGGGGMMGGYPGMGGMPGGAGRPGLGGPGAGGGKADN